MQRQCSIPDCGKPARSRGWCNPHYQRWLKHGDPLAPVIRKNWVRPGQLSVEERFWRLVDKSGAHWLWRGYINPKGYGQFQPKRGESGGGGAHRFAYQLLVGPIPAELQLDHLCRVRHCVWPIHLEVVTYLENQMRSPLKYGNKTHCQNGHAYTSENTIRCNRGKWQRCRICTSATQARHRQRSPRTS